MSRCLLRQEKESSCRVLDILPEKKNTQKASETTRSRNEKVKSFSTQTFIVSCRVAFYAKKRSRRVVSWIFFPKRRIPKKLLKPLEAGMRKLSHPQLKLLSCHVRMFFPKRRASKSFL